MTADDIQRMMAGGAPPPDYMSNLGKQADTSIYGNNWAPVIPGTGGTLTPNTVSMTNPGQIDLGWANPAMNQELNRARGTRDQMDSFLQGYLDPSRYAAREQDMQRRQSTLTQNRYASMGLAGSSVAQNAIDEGNRQVDFNWQDRAMGDHLKALQMNNMLTQPIVQDIQGIQGQFGDFQTNYVNAILGKQSNDDANSRALIGGIGSLLGGAAGFLAGGPMGGLAGAGLGGKLGTDVSGLNQTATSNPALNGSPMGADPYAYSPPYGQPSTTGMGQGYDPYGDSGYNPYFQ